MAAAGESRLHHSSGGEGDDSLTGRLILQLSSEAHVNTWDEGIVNIPSIFNVS